MLNRLKSPRRKSQALPPDEPYIEAPARPRPPREHVPVTRRITRLFGHGTPKFDPELERLEGQRQEVGQAHQDAQQRFTALESEIEQLQQKFTERERRRNNGELKKLTKELAVAQRFLSTADSLSQAEVVRALEALNEEIFQLTSICADMIQVERKQFLDEKHRAHAHQLLAPYLGQGFLDTVVPMELEDSLAMQIGWQGILAMWCSDLIQAWVVEDSGAGGTLNKDMRKIHEGVTSHSKEQHKRFFIFIKSLKSDTQAVAGRWRSIAHEFSDSVPPETRQELVSPVLLTLAALPLACGYIPTQKSHEELLNAFKQRIGPLVDKCLRFRKMVGAEITSTNIQPYICDSGHTYDPKSADLEYEDEKEGGLGQKQGVIACSLGLGLYSCHKLDAPGGKATESREPIAKPRVILQGTLEEIIS